MHRGMARSHYRQAAGDSRRVAGGSVRFGEMLQMVECPRCHHKFPENTSSQQAFELFHALRDEFAVAQGMDKVSAKDTLCVLFGVSLEYGDDFSPPKWPGVFCQLWGRRFFRKSILAYTPGEMRNLIDGSQEAINAKEIQ